MSLASQVDALAARVAAECKSLHGDLADAVTSTTITSIVKLTQAQYDALAVKDAATLYVVVG